MLAHSLQNKLHDYYALSLSVNAGGLLCWRVVHIVSKPGLMKRNLS